MWRYIIEILKLTALSLEIAFCLGIIARIFLEKSKMSLERILLYVGIGSVLSMIIYFNNWDIDTAEVFIYTLWGILIVIFLYEGAIFYKIWSIWVSCMLLSVVLGIIELLIGVILLVVGDLTIIEKLIENEIFCIPEIIGVMTMMVLFKKTPFYYKDKTCYRKISFLKKIMLLIIVTGIAYIIDEGMNAIDGTAGNVAQGDIGLFICIYVTLILGSLTMLQTYGEIHKTYTNKEELLIQSFTKKHVKTAQQLEKQDLFNQKDKEVLHHQISDLAQVAQEAGLDEMKRYADEIASAVEPMNQEFLLTGHRILDAVLREKYMMAKEKGIKLANKISIPDHIALNGTELSVIVGQALDYAIRQCECAAGEKSILVEGVWYKGYIMLKLWYSHGEEIIEDKRIEIQIIKRYVEKYEGKLNEVVEPNRSKLELSFNAAR